MSLTADNGFLIIGRSEQVIAVADILRAGSMVFTVVLGVLLLRAAMIENRAPASHPGYRFRIASLALFAAMAIVATGERFGAPVTLFLPLNYLAIITGMIGVARVKENVWLPHNREQWLADGSVPPEPGDGVLPDDGMV